MTELYPALIVLLPAWGYLLGYWLGWVMPMRYPRALRERVTTTTTLAGTNRKELG